MPATPEFDYDRHDLPPSVKYVGPYLWNKPANIVSPDWLQTLGHARPWVHATEGTIHVGEPLVLRATAQGLAGLEMEVIMTSGEPAIRSRSTWGPALRTCISPLDRP